MYILQLTKLIFKINVSDFNNRINIVATEWIVLVMITKREDVNFIMKWVINICSLNSLQKKTQFSRIISFYERLINIYNVSFINLYYKVISLLCNNQRGYAIAKWCKCPPDARSIWDWSPSVSY